MYREQVEEEQVEEGDWLELGDNPSCRLKPKAVLGANLNLNTQFDFWKHPRGCRQH